MDLRLLITTAPFIVASVPDLKNEGHRKADLWITLRQNMGWHFDTSLIRPNSSALV